MKTLIIEDDAAMIAILMRTLSAYHYIVDVVTDGEVGWQYLTTFDYDLILLDVMLPKIDGITLCQRFRAEGYTTPILLLTAQTSSLDKVRGLDAGADDYLIKPFDAAELGARIRALLRRSSSCPFPLLMWEDLVLNPSTCDVTYNNHPLTLTTKEYELLELFLRDSDHVFSSEEILDKLWSSEDFPAEATVRSHVRRLRHKLVAVGAPADFIATVHGRGYYLKTTARGSVAAIAPPLSTPPTLSAEQHTYLAFLNETWSHTQPQILEQLGQLMEIAQTLQAGHLDSSLQHQAHQISHKFVGTLGVFGLETAVQLARELDLLFQQPLQPLHAAQIQTLLTSLSEAVHRKISIAAPPSSLENEPNSPLAEIAEAGAASHQPGAALMAAGKKVMIVDDDPSWMMAALTLLAPWKFKVSTLADPQQFWTVLKAVQPDVLILDVVMPYLSGFDLCQQVRQDAQWRGLPVLILTATCDRQTEHQAFVVGADDYLCKPVLGDDLATRILNRWQRIDVYRNASA
jgi:DNA-binding response OmpR family regulator/HPt (histidine-containing phosphotransfer) domain-containing protein